MTPDTAILADGPDPAESFAAEVTTLFVEAADLLGVPKSVAMIYGVLFASPGPLTFADIETRTQISKGSVSQGLRFLREIGAVRPAAEAPADDGHRGRAVEHYEPVVELRALLRRLLTDKIQPQLETGEARVGEIARRLDTLDPAAREALTGRVRHLQVWQKRSRDFLPLFKAFLSFGK
ncbi:MAG: transcriptional regulator [Opitutaceae bacterium]|nr:transcriptional regulator [Opitutaceae bacterium]